jgi:hypothetical protein
MVEHVLRLEPQLREPAQLPRRPQELEHEPGGGALPGSLEVRPATVHREGAVLDRYPRPEEVKDGLRSPNKVGRQQGGVPSSDGLTKRAQPLRLGFIERDAIRRQERVKLAGEDALLDDAVRGSDAVQMG